MLTKQFIKPESNLLLQSLEKSTKPTVIGKPAHQQKLLRVTVWFCIIFPTLGLLYCFLLIESLPFLYPVIFERAISFQIFVWQEKSASIILSVCCLLSLFASRARLAKAMEALLAVPQLLFYLVLLVFFVTLLGTQIVYHQFPMTLDEYVPTVQATIFREGALLGRLPESQQENFYNYFPYFYTLEPETGYFTSYYRPVHAALIALFAFAGAQNLLNPLAAVLAAIMLFKVARFMFPLRPEVPALAVLLMVASPQFLAYAISHYPWTIHLAVSLTWFWLFLQQRTITHIYAMALGVFAVGIHQPTVHLAFSFPFLSAFLFGWRKTLSWPGHLAISGSYLVVYLTAVALWLLWDNIAFYLVTGDAQFIPTELWDVISLQPYLQTGNRLFDHLLLIRSMLTISNLLRFLLWVSPAIVFLVGLGLFRKKRPSSDILVMIYSVVLTIAVYVALMPNQMIGWGYRYLTPSLGVVAILASAAIPKPQNNLRAAVAAQVAFWLVVSVAIFVPLRGWQMHQMIAPQANEFARYLQSDADVIVHRTSQFRFGGNLVRNDPYLRNQPLIMTDLHLPLLTLQSTAVREVELVDLARLERHQVFVMPREFLFHPPGTTPAEHFVICPFTAQEKLSNVADFPPRQGPSQYHHCEVPLDSATFPTKRQDHGIP